MLIDLSALRETIYNIIDILISPLRKFRIKLKGKKMIHLNYEKKDNYPHHKKIILFDRDAFQSLGDAGLLKVNKKYNVLCPQVFVTECLAPNTQLTRFVARGPRRIPDAYSALIWGPPRNADFIGKLRIKLIWYNRVSEEEKNWLLRRLKSR